VLDACTEEEQAAGFLTMIEEHLELPFPVKIPGRQKAYENEGCFHVDVSPPVLSSPSNV
jgi:hypothetical protein